MAVIKEWRCLAHGAFESKEGVCPHGCTTVLREFRTAPGGRSEKTKKSDAAIEHLAKRYGLSDISNKNGSVGSSRPNPDQMQPTWGELPKGNVFQPGKGEIAVDGAAGGATAALSGMGMGAGMTAAQMMTNKYGEKFAAEPTFDSVRKTLPRVKPIIHESYGTAKDLNKAIADSK